MIDNNKVQQVWEKGIEVDGYDASQIRKDACGAFIVRTHYKNRDSDYGWEIDHVYPESRGGDDRLENLRPMQWENNEIIQSKIKEIINKINEMEENYGRK